MVALPAMICDCATGVIWSSPSWVMRIAAWWAPRSVTATLRIVALLKYGSELSAVLETISVRSGSGRGALTAPTVTVWGALQLLALKTSTIVRCAMSVGTPPITVCT